jgi:uncharacterized protein (DUF58 family)
MPPISPDILRQVNAIALRARGVVNALLAGEYRSVFRGQGMEFAEVRAYEPDDDFRAIDWNVSARFGSPFVKTFTEERELTVLVVVDQSGSARTGMPAAKAWRAVEVAAVLALAAARQHDRVGALLFTDHAEHVVRPGKGRRHALRVIRDMLAFEPAGKGTDLAGAIRYAARLLRHRSIVVVLSDFQAEGWEQPFRQLAARHDVVAVTVDDPRELAPVAAGWIEFEDAESGQRTLVNTGSEKGRRRWHALAARRGIRRSQILNAAGADHLALTTTDDFALPLRRVFAERLRRRGRRRTA